MKKFENFYFFLFIKSFKHAKTVFSGCMVKNVFSKTALKIFIPDLGPEIEF